MKCVFCGKEISDNSEFCEFCKNRIGYKEPAAVIISDKKQVNWILCLIMSIIFGYFAVDRFIIGQVGLGILKILTCGGCGIWYIIDIILIATKYNFKDIEWTEN
jgi:hypothetical protein